VKASDKIALGLACAYLEDIINGVGDPQQNAKLALHHLTNFKEVRELIDQVVEALEKN
tara:strand:+ start:5899 stop:6072 length:174 start_codon:yes stop_codon:yes gene_type:complete